MEFVPQNQYQPLPESPWYRHGWGVALIIMGVIFVVVAGWLIWAIFQMLSGASVIPTTATADLSTATAADLSQRSETRVLAEKVGRPTFGNPRAKLVIVEFGDFQCPKCGEEFPTIRSIMNQYKDEILFIYRNYPTIDENSPKLAEAGLCANEQNRFWQFHDRAYMNQSTLSLASIDVLAQQAGVDAIKFNKCLQDGKYTATVTEDAQDAVALGAQGTPTFLVNGHVVAGVLSVSDWQGIIDEALKILK